MSEDHEFKSSWTTKGDAVSKNKVMADNVSLVEHLLSIRGLDSILITEENKVPVSVCLCVYVYVSAIVSYVYTGKFREKCVTTWKIFSNS